MRSKSDILPKHKKIIAAAAVLIVSAAVLFFYIESGIRKYSSDVCADYCRAWLSESVSNSVSSVLEKTGTQYSDLSAEVYDENGRLVSAKLCSSNINIIQNMIISEVNKSIGNLESETITVPSGSLSGLFLLSGRGPDIKVKLIPVGSAQAELKSSFEFAGINQTCHKISLDIKAEARAVFPYSSEKITVNLNCILAENIIIGEVPLISAN